MYKKLKKRFTMIKITYKYDGGLRWDSHVRWSSNKILDGEILPNYPTGLPTPPRSTNPTHCNCRGILCVLHHRLRPRAVHDNTTHTNKAWTKSCRRMALTRACLVRAAPATQHPTRSGMTTRPVQIVAQPCTFIYILLYQTCVSSHAHVLP